MQNDEVSALLGVEIDLAACNTLASCQDGFRGAFVSRRSFGSVFGAFCLRARGETTSPLSSTGDGGTGEAPPGLGLDGATELSEGLPVGRRRWTADAGAGGSCT